MPGYASNRVISIIIAKKQDLDASVLDLQEQIDDLALGTSV